MRAHPSTIPYTVPPLAAAAARHRNISDHLRTAPSRQPLHSGTDRQQYISGSDILLQISQRIRPYSFNSRLMNNIISSLLRDSNYTNSFLSILVQRANSTSAQIQLITAHKARQQTSRQSWIAPFSHTPHKNSCTPKIPRKSLATQNHPGLRLRHRIVLRQRTRARCMRSGPACAVGDSVPAIGGGCVSREASAVPSGR